MPLGGRRGRALLLAAGAVILIVAVVTGIVVAITPSSSGPSLVRLSAAPLGVNVAPWDGIYSAADGDVMQPMLKAAGIKQLRYGGGSYADYYNWQTNTSIGDCLPDNATASFTSRCATPNPLGFGQFAQRARAIGAESLVTVNYGSGTPAMAAAWVRAAARTPGEGVALWEVGNESYGCWEVNNPLAGPPEHYQGYRPAAGSGGGQFQTCPATTQGTAAGSKTLATSYADNALLFMRAMKAADPAARIGVPWELGASGLGGSGAASDVWNATVLETDGGYLGFVDAHYYPFGFSGATGGGNPSDAQVLAALRQIPSLYASTRAQLAARDPGAAVVIGETGVSSAATTTACTPVGAVFAAGDALSWLAAGAQSVDWFDLNNYGNTGAACVKPDYGLFTSAASPVPETPYYGYLLAAKLAVPGALLGSLTTSDPADVLAFQSALPDGAHAVALLNLNTSASPAVTFATPSGMSGTLNSWSYSAGAQNAANSKVVTGTRSAASLGSGITLPPESVTVLESASP